MKNKKYLELGYGESESGTEKFVQDNFVQDNNDTKIVQDNLGLVWSVVKRFYGRGFEIEDLFQIGCIGLIKASRRFNASYEFKFSTYAVSMIIGEIKRFLRDNSSIKVSRSLKETFLKAKYAREELEKELNRETTIGEVASKMGISSEDLTVAMEANQPTESLYSKIGDKDGNSTFLVDKIVGSISGESNVINKIALKQIINDLEIKEKQIIMLRYFKQYTQTRVAKMIGISQVQVCRIEARVLKVIRKKLLNT